MAYVAVSGGKEAIEESVRLLDYYRGSREVDLSALISGMSLLIDRVMSEAGLYSKEYAALALRQCEGCIEEAVFLLRAYRSTLTRNYYTNEVNTGDMRVVRRISAAFKDILGGQILGATYDYTHRLLSFTPKAREITVPTEEKEKISAFSRVSDTLKAEGIMEAFARDDSQPADITENILEFPTDRSARLQTLTRADTGWISGLAYSSLRGFGATHPTVGELRCGYAELTIPYPFGEGEEITIGEILMTEVECFVAADKDGELKIAAGYGAVLGRNENKAIAMSILDRELSEKSALPTQNEEFVLTHGDSLEMNGFISHLKLPHYVTFQSKLDAVRKTRRNAP